MTARLLLPADAPRDEWLAARREGVTASEIPAILGISPFDSAFNIYWKKTGQIPEDYDNDRLSLGRHMEPWIADRWAEEHRDEFVVALGGLYASEERPWQMATPDRLLLGHAEEPEFAPIVTDANEVAVLEIKTSGTYDGWGDDGTSDVPPYIAAQVLWQMDVLEARAGYVACLFLHTQQIRTYIIDYDAEDIALMRQRGHAFHQRVLAGDAPPIDDHIATTAALKALYPDVDDAETAEVPADIAAQYRAAKAAAKEADARVVAAENALRAAMGDAKVATDPDGHKVASRSVYDRKGYTVGPARIDRLNPTRTSKKEAA